jgi:hypothetical protein
MIMVNEIRGIRNNNPGNIRHGANWVGLSDYQSDAAFCRFKSPEYGIRAMCKILINYKRKYKLNTVRGIISRWAPPNENDTEAYIKSVCDKLHVYSPDAEIDTEQQEPLLLLATAIIQHENGINPYSREVILRGVRLAGAREG